MYYGDNNYGPRTYEEQYDAIKGMNAYITKVFGWMFIGLILTTLVGLAIASNLSLVYTIVTTPVLFYGLMIAELAVVIILSARITRLSYMGAVSLFMVYAALNGVTFSLIFLAFTDASIISAFGTTAVTFGVMCAYGYFTRNDLTRFRSILFMGLIGVLVLSLVNIFLASSSIGWIISLVSLFVFLGLTAYDMQKLKAFYFSTEGNLALRNNLGIYGALQLYLDFINLFLTILRFMGKKRN